MLYNCYSFSVDGGVKIFAAFSPGVHHWYYNLVYARPLGPHDEGYDEVRCWAQGLGIVTLDLREKCFLENPKAILLTPIYVVNLHHFEARTIQFRDGQVSIFGAEKYWKEGASAAVDAIPVILDEKQFPINSFHSLRIETFLQNGALTFAQFQQTGIFVLRIFPFAFVCKSQSTIFRPLFHSHVYSQLIWFYN